MNDKSIAIFNPTNDLHTNPSLQCLIDELSLIYDNVDIYVPQLGFKTIFNKNVHLFRLQKHFDLWSGGIKSTLRSWKWSFLSFSLKSRGRLRNQHYESIIGIDMEGSFLAQKLCRKKQIPLVYLSHEIFFSDELVDPGDCLMKKREIEATKSASLVIVQDKWRAGLLREENGISPEKFVFLPVAGRKSVHAEKTNYLRKKHKIPSEKTIVIHSGSFVAYNYAAELVEQVGNWPLEFMVVIHTRIALGKDDPFIGELLRRAYPNVILSTEPLSTSEYDEMIRSADVGLAFYKPIPGSKFTHKNIATIGLSSGKVSSYTKNGIPIVSVNQISYKELMKDYKFGIDVEKFEEIPSALNKIRNEYSVYSNDAREFFLEKLDFEKHWPDLWGRLQTIK